MSRFIYEFKLNNGEVASFDIDLSNPKRHSPDIVERAPWTRLDYHQCEHCPLSSKDFAYCPVAADIEHVADKFKEILSFERAEVWVRTPDRDYFKECDVQTGLKSLIGLIMPSGECPILSRLRPMAHFHLPFSSVEETIFRTVGTYLTKQYFLHKEGRDPDLELGGLEALYEDLQTLNIHFIDRIRAASKRDANLNALNILFSLSAIVSMTLDEKLRELRPLFFHDLIALRSES